MGGSFVLAHFSLNKRFFVTPLKLQSFRGAICEEVALSLPFSVSLSPKYRISGDNVGVRRGVGRPPLDFPMLTENSDSNIS